MNNVKNFFIKYFYNKEFRSKLNLVVELPLVVVCLCTRAFSVMLWSLIGLGIINACITLISQKILAKKLKAGLDNINIKEEENA